MGFRRLTFLLSVTYALSFAACGDNKAKVFDDAMTDTGDELDDAPIDTPDAPPNCGAAPNALCNGTCTNTNTDNNNCGTCGNACGSGETCSAGICCTTGQTNCGGTCVDTTSDEANCGGCAPPTGTGDVCDTNNGETCMNSTCCGGSNTACGNQCFDLQTDPNHCGSCTTMCAANQDCSAGHCCADGQIWCGNQCVDPDSDEANCGGCAGAGGVVCSGANDTCDNGICCEGDPILNCSGNSCTNTDTDEANCGACGAACPVGQECTSGKCCGAGTISCNGVTCINPNTDNTNCGGCAGTAGADTCVAGEVCDLGDCCGPGQQNCGNGCVDILDDFDNCGACGDPCAAGEVCSGGACVATCGAGETQCGNDCVDLTSDHDNCNACGNACGPSQVCSNGTCTSSCTLPDMSCQGSCVDLSTDPNHCGTCTTNCATGDVCSAGICCDAGLVNTGGICCAPGSINCNNQCVDPTNDATCGSCNNNCLTAGGTCEADADATGGSAALRCCPAGQVNCNGTCADIQSEEANCGACGVTCSGTCDDGICCTGANEQHCTGTTCQNIMTDEAHCGGCGLACDSGETCSDGICCPDGTQSTPPASGVGANICCASNETNCGGTCRDLTNGTPGTPITNCGMCGLNCGTNQVCDGGICSNTCTAPNNTSCGICTNPLTDENACGAGCEICAAGATCNAGDCQCPTTTPSECTITGGGTVCVDTGGVPTGTAGGNAAHCGACGAACTAGLTCDDLVLNIAASPTGATGSGSTATFVTTRPHGFVVGQLVYVQGVGDTDYNTTTTAWTVLTVPNTTTFTVTIPGASGGTLSNSGGGTVRTGECCGAGLQACPGTVGNAPVCANLQSDSNNCGACGTTCANGQTCTNGTCGCPFGTTLCGGSCVVTSNDPSNCGGCNISCGSGANTGKPYCVSNGCVAACPAPLSACGAGASAVCTNRNSDNNNCGSCGNVCPNGQGCVSGTCRPKLALLPDPAKCVGGGPPIVVPDGSGGTDCTGNLGAVSFTFALCSRTNMGPLSQDVFTDAFNSLVGPHVATCTTDADCGTVLNPGKCVGDASTGRTCVGGGVGLNGTVAPVLGGSKRFEVGGDFWVMGMIGLDRNGDNIVKQRTFIRDDLNYGGGTHRWFGDAYVNGPLEIGGSGSLRIDGTLFTADTPCDASTSPDADITINGNPKCVPTAWDTTRRDPCGTQADLIPVRSIVEYFRDPARNDNKTIGLRYDALANPSTDTRVELNCGYYYLDSLGGSNEVTIVVKGRAALFIGGSANINVEMIFDVAPTASLDIFVGSVVRIAHPITLGSPAYPRLTRMWIGSATGGGGGTSCTSNAQCTSGLCTACNNNPDPNAVYTASCSATPGTCTGGQNLSQAIDMAQGGYFNGLLWAGYGSVSTSNAVEMYGSIFTNYLDASGTLKVHYDKGAVQNQECPPPPSGGSCESCRDCGNQACVNNQCGACTSDSQCCPPLRCGPGGSCIL